MDRDDDKNFIPQDGNLVLQYENLVLQYENLILDVIGNFFTFISNFADVFKNIYSPHDMQFPGSVIHDIDTVDPAMAAMAEETRGALRLRGIKGLKSILEKTKWKPDNIMDKNPVYGVFTLKKN